MQGSRLLLPDVVKLFDADRSPACLEWFFMPAPIRMRIVATLDNRGDFLGSNSEGDEGRPLEDKPGEGKPTAVAVMEEDNAKNPVEVPSRPAPAEESSLPNDGVDLRCELEDLRWSTRRALQQTSRAIQLLNADVLRLKQGHEELSQACEAVPSGFAPPALEPARPATPQPAVPLPRMTREKASADDLTSRMDALTADLQKALLVPEDRVAKRIEALEADVSEQRRRLDELGGRVGSVLVNAIASKPEIRPSSGQQRLRRPATAYLIASEPLEQSNGNDNGNAAAGAAAANATGRAGNRATTYALQ